MLTPIIPPTTSNLMAPDTVRTRLKLPESDLEEVTELVAEASGLVARYLNFRPEYTTWRETFAGVSGDRLFLGARPVWSVEGVTYRGDTSPQAADAYWLDRGPYGESSLRRSWGHPWGVLGYEGSPEWSIRLWTGGVPELPDWSIDYTAGWWLEEMEGEPPAGVERFPCELQADFLRIVRWLRSSGGDVGELAAMGISKMSNEGMSVEFATRVDQGYQDRLLPVDLVSMPLYRRVA